MIGHTWLAYHKNGTWIMQILAVYFEIIELSSTFCQFLPNESRNQISLYVVSRLCAFLEYCVYLKNYGVTH